MNIIDSTSTVYGGALIRETIIEPNCIIGSDSFVTDSKLFHNVCIERRNMILNSTIGKYSGTGPNTTIRYSDIGKYCSISWNVSIGGANHPLDRLTTHAFPFVGQYGFCTKNEWGEWQHINNQRIVIENDVWIAAGVNVVRGVKIENGAVVGAGAVVTKNIGPYEIWAGIPAKKIGQRFCDEIIAELLDLQWWNLSEEVIKANIHYFQKTIDINTICEIKHRVYDM